MRRALPWVAAGAGLLLIVAGLVAFVVANRVPVGDFGWSTYAPLQPRGAYDSSLVLTLDDGWTVLWTGRHLLGAGLAVSGLLVMAALGGWLIGRRHRGPPPP